MCFSLTQTNKRNMTTTAVTPPVEAAQRKSFFTTPATAADYREAIVPKFRRVNGRKIINGTRTLHIPSPELLHAQYSVLQALKELRLPISQSAHGYVRSRSILTMAKPHVKHKYLVRIDIKDFFPSIRQTQVVLALERVRPGSHNLLQLIRNTCFLDGGLPQGAPTSPALSNLVMLRIDSRIRQAIRYWKTSLYDRVGVHRVDHISYTRYADDLVFSSDYPYLRLLIPTIKRILESEGFVVNKDKIFVLSAPHRLEVCGVVVNDKTSTPRTYRRSLRSKLHRIVTQDTPKGRMRDHRRRLTDIPFDSLRSQVAHVSHICPSQGESLKKLFQAAVEVHTQEQANWSPFTNEYIKQYRTKPPSAD